MKRKSSLRKVFLPFSNHLENNQQPNPNNQNDPYFDEQLIKESINFRHHSSSHSKAQKPKREIKQMSKYQDNYFITSPNSLKTVNKGLKRTSMVMNKNVNNYETHKRTFPQSAFKKGTPFKAIQKLQTLDGAEMDLSFNDIKQGVNSKQRNQKKQFNIKGYISGVTTPSGKPPNQIKWQKVIQLYTMREQLSKKYEFSSMLQLRKKYPILPGGQFYRILTKDKVFQKQWRINFPQTIFQDAEGNTVMIYTDKVSGILKRKVLQKQGKDKQRYRDQVLKFRQGLIDQLEKTGKIRLLKDVKIKENPNVPLTIMKYTEDQGYQFETQVQSYRNFLQRRLKPTRDSILQRYIYSNNLKAMVFRLYYNRQTNDSSNKPEFEGMKFQNQKSIFKESQSNSFPDFHKLTSIITLSQQRINSIKVFPINNPKTLQKYIPFAKQLINLLQFTQKVLIEKLYFDFIVDIFDKPWLINIKYCQVKQHSLVKNPSLKTHTQNVASCRLCGVVVQRNLLNHSVSVRMLCDFVNHLKKRTKQEDMHRIEFVQNLNINTMQNKTSYVCKVCYKVIIHELQLIKMEKKLAQICNIIPSQGDQYLQQDYKASKESNNIGKYNQWRLMLYFEDIKNVQTDFYETNPSLWNSGSLFYTLDQFNKKETTKGEGKFLLKYELCPKIYESFLCKKQNGFSTDLNVNQVKLHYFYSETTNIEDFINNTEIIISLYYAENKINNRDGQFQRISDKPNDKFFKSYHNEKLIASGSTHILSSFNLHKSSTCTLKNLMENGQKQITTVLLFFQNKKYCQLTLKVGLVFDGCYNVANIPIKRQNKNNEISQFIKLNDVWFSRNIWNSNPLPKQWMDIFGSKYNYDSNLHSFNKDEFQQNQDQEQLLKRILQTSDIESSSQQS